MTFLKCVLLFTGGLAIVWFARYPVQWFSNWLYRESDVQPGVKGVPPWIVGEFERLLAFAIFFLKIEDAYTLLIAWMAAKIAANWQRRPWPDEPEEARRLRAETFIALMAGTLSLFFGVVGGSIAHCGCF
jgi:hypothetical protein